MPRLSKGINQDMTADIIPTPYLRKARMRQALDEWRAASEQWIEKTITLALELKAVRDECHSNQEFSVWLAENDCDDLSKNTRAALINIAEHLELSREVLQITDRRSVELIWDKEIKPKIAATSSERSEDDVIPIHSAESPQNVPQEPERIETAIPKDAECKPEKSDLPRRPLHKGHGRRSPLKGLHDAELVNAHMLEKQARAEFGKFVRTPKGRPAWALLIESIETGLYGPPTRADSTTSMTVRVLLPWLPQRSFAGFHLKDPLTRKLVCEVLFPMLRERPELRETPHLVEREFNARRRAIEEDARRKSKLDEHKAKIQAGAMAAGEQAIVAFGEPLWPPQRPDLTSPYSYKELCHACWFVGYFLGIARPGWKPTETAMAGRHLAKYIEPVQPGFVAAVRAIFNAYEDHPNGEQQFPPIPVNFGS
jgi:hypothetical protein